MEKKEYIERDKLIKWLQSCKNACIEVCKGLINNIEEYAAENVIAAYDDCIGYVESAPAADVVKVVWCEDCRFCKKHPTSDKTKMCTNEQQWVTECYPLVFDSDYCSYGERKEK